MAHSRGGGSAGSYLVETHMTEIWRATLGNNDYLVSSYGRIKSLKKGSQKILAAIDIGDGHL